MKYSFIFATLFSLKKNNMLKSLFSCLTIKFVSWYGTLTYETTCLAIVDCMRLHLDDNGTKRVPDNLIRAIGSNTCEACSSRCAHKTMSPEVRPYSGFTCVSLYCASVAYLLHRYRVYVSLCASWRFEGLMPQFRLFWVSQGGLEKGGIIRCRLPARQQLALSITSWNRWTSQNIVQLQANQWPYL